MNLKERQIQEFAQLVERDQRERYRVNYGSFNHSPEVKQLLEDQACVVSVKPAAKYTKVDVGSSGRFMVVNETGEIFGVKGYGVIHRGHAYGTLETVDEWFWGEYHPVRKVTA